MKKQNKLEKINPIKKIFVKLCRIIGYEIIDQNELYIPTLDKFYDEELSDIGKKSISLPLGEVKITRSIQTLDIIVKTCTSVNLVSQSKKRIFEEAKSEYTFRTINSIIKSINYAKKKMPGIGFKLFVIDHDSKPEDLQIINSKLVNSNISYDLLNLDINEFDKSFL